MNASGYIGFAHAVLKDKNGGHAKMASMHIAWIAHISYAWEREMGALINAPMGHGKTSLVAVGLPLFEMGSDVNTRIKIVSATDQTARDRTGAIRSYIDEDPDYRRLYPHVRPSKQDAAQQRRRQWAGHKLFIQRTAPLTDATLEAKGILSSGVGGRASLLIFDDPVDEKNSRSEIGRLAVLDKFEKEWMTRLEPTGRWAMISTPYHHQDLNAHLRRNPRVCVLVQAISADYRSIEYQVFNAPDRDHPLMRFST